MADGLSLDSDKTHDVMTTSTEDDDGSKSTPSPAIASPNQVPSTDSSNENTRKRKRLSAVLDKLTTQVERRSVDSTSSEEGGHSSSSPSENSVFLPNQEKTFDFQEIPRSKMRALPQKHPSIDSGDEPLCSDETRFGCRGKNRLFAPSYAGTHPSAVTPNGEGNNDLRRLFPLEESSVPRHDKSRQVPHRYRGGAYPS